MSKRLSVNWTDRLGLGSIALVSLGYITCASSFAERCLSLPFLSFPIFIGEILMAFCTILLIVKLVRKEWKIGRERWALGAYVLFVVIKVFLGYGKWGAMALRDSAMFYYPAFALFGYCFWPPAGWRKSEQRLAFGVLLTLLIFHCYHFFWPFPLILLALVLAQRENDKAVRFLFIVAVLFLAPYEALFLGVRTVVLATTAAIAFILISLLCAVNFRRKFSFVWIALGVITLLVFSAKALHSGFWHRVDPRRILGELREPATISDWGSPSIKLYNPDRRQPLSWPDKTDRTKVPCNIVMHVDAGPVGAPGAYMSDRTPKSGGEDQAPPVSAFGRPIGVDFDNARFRLYIWRDMLIELGRAKPVFGFDFGYPLRSPSMKAYGFSTTQDEDGWVAAHNSFLHMVYRGGIVGLAVVGLVLFYWVGLVRDTIRQRSRGGILLCAVLLYWMVAAGFFLIWELPYTAIPFWFFLGITAKYRSFLRKSQRPGVTLSSPTF